MKILYKEEVEKRFYAGLNNKKILFFSAVLGMGKTAITKELLSKKKISSEWYSCYGEIPTEKIYESLEEVIRNSKKKVIVIDDFQEFPGDKCEKLSRIIANSSKEMKFIFLSRSKIPASLEPFRFTGMMEEFYRDDLVIGIDLIAKTGLLNDEDLMFVHEYCRGLSLSVCYSIDLILKGETDRLVIENEVAHRMYLYLDTEMFARYSKEMQHFMMCVTGFKRFTETMAQMTAIDKDVKPKILEMLNRGSFIKIVGEETYEVLALYNQYIEKHCIPLRMSEDEIKNIYYNAGLYYEIQDDIHNALDYYSKSGDYKKMSMLLLDNLRKHPGAGHYHDMEKYYTALPAEIIMSNSELIVGMAMLYSLKFDIEQSNKWVSRMDEFLKQNPDKKKEVELQKIKMSIVLPQYGVSRIDKMIMELFKGNISIGTVSVTANMNSLLNGGKDFSEWTKKDSLLYNTIGKAIPAVLGDNTNGLTELAIGESKYEKCEWDKHKILTTLSKGLGETEKSQNYELMYVGSGIIARLYVANGDANRALNLLTSFREKIVKENKNRILRNLDAQIALTNLYLGNKVPVERWMKTTPNEDKDFFILDRYIYKVKMLVYIYEERYLDAITLGTKIIATFELFKRNIDTMKASAFVALALYRDGSVIWKEYFNKALDISREYKYYRFFAEYAAPFMPMLREFFDKDTSEYAKVLLEEVKKENILYPNFLKKEENKIGVSFNDTEKDILLLIINNKSNNEIAQILNLSINTVKWYLKKIYQTLGVSTRVEAAKIAKDILE